MLYFISSGDIIMDELTFTIELVKSLSWPLTLLIVVMILRKPIIELPSLIKKLKIKDVEIEFDKKVEELKEEALKQLPVIEQDETRLRRNRFLIDLAQVSPRSAILESWIELENTSLKSLKEKELENVSLSSLSPLQLGDLLIKSDILDENKMNIYHQLRNLRNAAVHATDLKVTPLVAVEYLNMANLLTGFIENRIGINQKSN